MPSWFAFPRGVRVMLFVLCWVGCCWSFVEAAQGKPTSYYGHLSHWDHIGKSYYPPETPHSPRFLSLPNGYCTELPSVRTCPYGAWKWCGRYRIQRVVYHGTHSIVYKALDLDFEDGGEPETVALKVFPNGEFQEFVRERAVMDRAREKGFTHLMTYRDTFQLCLEGQKSDSKKRQHFVLVMDWAQDTIYTITNVASEERVMYYSGELLQAVDELHSMGLVHTDIKPDNIFIMHNGSLMLGDFGGVRTEQELQLQEERPVGTYGYMAPEVFLRQPDHYTGKMDLFSVGMVLFQLYAKHAAVNVNPNSHSAMMEDLRIFLGESPNKEQNKRMLAMFPNMTPIAFQYKENQIMQQMESSKKFSKTLHPFAWRWYTRRLLQPLLQWEPERRPTAKQMLREWKWLAWWNRFHTWKKAEVAKSRASA